MGRPQYPKMTFTREHVNELIHNRALEERSKMVEVYKPLSGDFSWTTDFWTSAASHEIMAITAHGLDKDFNMVNFFLGGRLSPEAHTGIIYLFILLFSIILLIIV